ncbi:MAG: NUDIX hydrolase [Kangiellaceae bacterium]|nr:NUDIX hydrolase [Kangiellaceae bacterium]
MLPIHVTVAAVIEGQGEHKGKFLMVEEKSSTGEIVFNQPAGHLECSESLEQAVIREVKEETGIDFKPTALVGTYTLNPASNSRYYQRFCFTGNVACKGLLAPQDSDIIAAHWMTIEDIVAVLPQHRSGLIVQCFQDYLSGQRYPLSSLICSDDEEHIQRQGIEFLQSYQWK